MTAVAPAVLLKRARGARLIGRSLVAQSDNVGGWAGQAGLARGRLLQLVADRAGLKNAITSWRVAVDAEVLRTSAHHVPPGLPPAAKCRRHLVRPAEVRHDGSSRVENLQPVPRAICIVTTARDAAGAVNLTS